MDLGAHYTGATMGMPYASRSVSLWPALAIVAVFSLLGAILASGKVEQTVGLHLISQRNVSATVAIVIVGSAGALTMAFNYLRLPTSTIQILVFCVIGAALAARLSVHWSTLGKLVIVWVAAPIVAVILGFTLVRLLDRIVPPGAAAEQARLQLAHQPDEPHPAGDRSAVRVPGVALGLPDAAGAIGGAGLFVGALTWGRRILDRVAFDVVRLDLAMASAAQGVQAFVVILAVSQGFFTSMNQALVAAMAGTGVARGRETVNRAQLVGILRGWLIGPAAGFLLAYIIQTILD